MNMSNINVEWVTNESAVTDFAATAHEGGATVLETKDWAPGPDELDDYGDAMFEPLAAVALIVAAGWLIRRIVDVLDDVMRPGGQLVHIRDDGSVIVRPLPKTKPPGKLVIIKGTDTPQVFLPDRRDDGLALLGNLLGAIDG
jgi:hypothetical protein